MKERKPFSLMIIALALALFCSYHIYYHFINMTSGDLVRDYYYQEKEDVSSNVALKLDNEKYLGLLTIPKINLKTGFYNINSKKNNVNNSVTLLKESIMPEDKGSIIYLAAHSGSGYLAYFKDLNQLKEEDIITITYNAKDYHYSVNSIYEMPKNGEITVNHNIHEKALVLTTCSKNRNMQLIVFAKMINKV